MLKNSPHAAAPYRDSAAEVFSDLETLSEYLLVCGAEASGLSEGRWHFALEAADGALVFSADDDDFGDLNRLTLLAAVRGLEAIDGASAVTLLSSNRYLIRSLSDSLPRWRDNDFVWEHFGRRIDVQHADLWRRIDRALSIHRVEACLISSRLVSSGQAEPIGANRWSDPSLRLRVDSPHPIPAHHGSPKAGPETRRPDHLRRWLLGGGASASQPVARRRFTSADLLESA